MKDAFGFIETVGKAAAIEAMDTAVKAADVELAGLENSRGGGCMTVKITGEISAVKAAVEAAVTAVQAMGGTVFAHNIIAKASDELENMLTQTMGKRDETRWYAGDDKKTLVTEPLQEESTEPEPQLMEEVIEEEKKPTCNLCGDPRCERVRGEARIKCIHYNELIKK